jgi:hypothetical protein
MVLLERCAEHLLGDFAFAIWDAANRRVFCARDNAHRARKLCSPSHHGQGSPTRMRLTGASVGRAAPQRPELDVTGGVQSRPGQSELDLWLDAGSPSRLRPGVPWPVYTLCPCRH